MMGDNGNQEHRLTQVVHGTMRVLCYLSLFLIASTGLALAAAPDKSAASTSAQRSDSDTDATATAADSADIDESFLQASDCQALFGTDRSHRRNRTRRERALQSVRGSRTLVTVVHHTRWDDPVRLRIPGLEVLAIIPADSRSFDLLVAVSPHVAESHHCEPGVYRLSQDDSLLPGVAILDVRRRFLLIDSRGVLTYIPVGEIGEIDFRMVWQSAWTIPRPKEEITASKRKRNRKSRRNRSKRRRGRRR